jgi:hypothetical protein
MMTENLLFDLLQTMVTVRHISHINVYGQQSLKIMYFILKKSMIEKTYMEIH